MLDMNRRDDRALMNQSLLQHHDKLFLAKALLHSAQENLQSVLLLHNLPPTQWWSGRKLIDITTSFLLFGYALCNLPIVEWIIKERLCFTPVLPGSILVGKVKNLSNT